MSNNNKKPAQGGQRRSASNDATRLPIREVRIGYVLPHAGHRATGGHYVMALYAKPINLLHAPCTCWASGTCEVCQAWAGIIRRMQERRVARC